RNASASWKRASRAQQRNPPHRRAVARCRPARDFCARSSRMAIDYLRPDLPPGLQRISMPAIEATPAALQDYGHLVDDPAQCGIEIVRWRPRGWRRVDDDTGDRCGT